MTESFIQVCLDDLVNHAELVAKLTIGPGLIKDSEGAFPKTTANGKNGVVLCKIYYVTLLVPDGGSRKMTRDFSKVDLHHMLYGSLRFGLFGENYLSYNCVHISV